MMASSVNLCHDGISMESMRESFSNDGFALFPDSLTPHLVSKLQSRLEAVLRGQYDRGSAPDKSPKLYYRSDAPLGYDGKTQQKVLQIININKCDNAYRELAMNENIGKMVADLAGWKYGARLAQDQVWAKPPGAPPLVFHRDSPYFMFTPDDVVTVWVALDDMIPELGPLEYVKGSHKWGDGRVGSSSSFFQSENRKLLYSAAKLEGIENPETTLEIVSMSGLKAGGISIHHGKCWHGSGKNRSTDRPRRGLGLHFVPAEVKWTQYAKRSKLWKRYVPDVSDEDLANTELSDDIFPIVWKRPR